ncbi:MAG: RNA polymerase sigma factor [Ilumatobacteraceae bacterium]
MSDPDRGALGQLYRQYAGQLLGALMAVFHDLDVAEEALHDALLVAMDRWAVDGTPRDPAAWLYTVARRRGLDQVRREHRRSDKQRRAVAGDGALGAEDDPRWEASMTVDTGEAPGWADDDDHLRLIFTCCHPSLAADAQVALILRALCGLSTREIAAAFLIDEPTMAQRLVRAKRKIRTAGIPFVVPPADRLADRVDVVAQAIYLVFNEGYAASAGDVHVRRELCGEAIRLARLLVRLLPDEPEPIGLLALMLLHDSRRDARVDATGDVVLIADQDRMRWDQRQIDEGADLADRALRFGRVGRYQVEAAIAALHATSPHPDATDWPQITALFGVLTQLAPSPVVALNRAVAIAMADGPDAGLAALADVDGLDDHHLFHSARADLLRRSGRQVEAAAAYRRALDLAHSEPDRRFLRARLAALTADP